MPIQCESFRYKFYFVPSTPITTSDFITTSDLTASPTANPTEEPSVPPSSRVIYGMGTDSRLEATEYENGSFAGWFRGNYPYSLKSSIPTGTVYPFDENFEITDYLQLPLGTSWVPEAEVFFWRLRLQTIDDYLETFGSFRPYAIYCNQGIEFWEYVEIENRDAAFCPDGYQMTGCYDSNIVQSDGETFCVAPGDELIDAIIGCHKPASDQELECFTYFNLFTCPQQETMLFCSEGDIDYPPSAPNGVCICDEIDCSPFIRCCNLYKIEPFDANPRYISVDSTLSCEDDLGSSGASIQTQEDLQAAIDICGDNCVCLLGGRAYSNETLYGNTTFWSWDDGSGTFPSKFTLEFGGFWANIEADPRTRACVDCQFNGIRDCSSENEHRLCNNAEPILPPTQLPTTIPAGTCCACVDLPDDPGCPFDALCEGLVCNDPSGDLENCCTESWVSVCGQAAQTICDNSQTRRLLLNNDVNDDGIDDLCFEMDMSLTVENILPDPSYILPDLNFETIRLALEQSFEDENINDFTIESIANNIDSTKRRMQIEPNTTIIENNCPHATPDTGSIFPDTPFPFDIDCDGGTFTRNRSEPSIGCNITTPDSIVYGFTIDKFISKTEICPSGWNFTAQISDPNGRIFLTSDTWNATKFYDIRTLFLNFTFSESLPFTLRGSTTYFIKIFGRGQGINECLGKGPEDQFGGFEFIDVSYLTTEAAPSPCILATNLAISRAMDSGTRILCNPENEDEKEIFATFLYQQHSSQNFIAFPKNSTRRRLQTQYASRYSTRCRTCGSGVTNAPAAREGSLGVIFEDGTIKIIANDSVFPRFDQCLAVDEDTNRVFSVGGNVSNGTAIDRLAVYSVNGTDVFKIREIKLDKPRANNMCWYLKYENGKEYVMVINGMDNANDLSDSSLWFSDIVFIPLNESENVSNFASISLKYNVLDMRIFVTEKYGLYLFGGRNETNAVNFVQYFDLNRVLNGSANGLSLTTIDRMQPLKLNRILPFVDFPLLNGERCIMVFGGQNVENNEFIPIDIPVRELQLYCNDVLVAYLQDNGNNLRRRLQNDGLEYVNNEYTWFDERRAVGIPFNETSSTFFDVISVTEYNFENDGILQNFDTSYKVCFDDQSTKAKAVNYLKNESNLNVLDENILSESQIDFQGWSFGFGQVNVSKIVLYGANITLTADPTRDPSPSPTPSPSVSPTFGSRPNECNDFCDAFSVIVNDFEVENDAICITYDVERLFDSGYYCYESIKYLILGICEDDYGEIDVDDLDALIIKDNDHNGRSGSSSEESDSSESDDVWAVKSGSTHGIFIKMKIDTESRFELCLKNVFDDEVQFSNSVRFRRGRRKFTCDNEWVMGLPCLDMNKFASSRYDSGSYSRSGSDSSDNYRAKVNEEKQSEVRKSNTWSIARWEIWSCIVLFSFCLIASSLYCLIWKRQFRKRTGFVKTSHSDDDDDDDDDGSVDGDCAVTDGRFISDRIKLKSISECEMQSVTNNWGRCDVVSKKVK